ncbi:MAG: tape measure protein [Rhizobacter sp.]
MADPKIKFDILANAQGDESINRLTTELEKLDKSIDGDVAARAQALAGELRALGAQSAAIDRFRELKNEAGAAGGSLGLAKVNLDAFTKEMIATGPPTRTQTGQLEKLKDTVRLARNEFLAKSEALTAARGELGRLGIATEQLENKEASLRSAVQAARTEIQTLGQQQQAVQRITELAQATEKARAALGASDAALVAYRRSIADLANPTQAQQRELERLTNAVRTSQVAFLQAAQAQASSAASARAAGVDTDRLAQAAQRVANSYRTQATEATRSAATQSAAHKQIAQGVDSINTKLGTLQNIGIAGILGGQTSQLLRSVAETADQFSNLSARIRLVTGDGAAFEAAMQGVYEVAKNTSSSLEGTATLFTRIAQAGKEIGLSQKDALALTQSINQAVQVSGASAQASDAAITQLIQGLQGGVLRGEEFNSVMEQAPRLAQALAAGLGVTTGELRKLANEGQLSSTTVIRALQSQRQALETEFGQLPATVGRALTNLQTEWAKFIGGLNNSTGATGAVAAGINTIAENLEVVARLAGVAGTALVAGLAVKGAAALRAYAAEAALAAGATNLLTASIAKVPAVVNITVAAVGFEVGYEIGRMLQENSELARQLGVGIVGFFELLVNDLQFIKEAAVAVFTDATVDDAIERWKTKNLQVGSTIRDMMADAKQGPREVAQAAEEATQKTEQLGTAATSTGQQIAAAAPQAVGAMGQIGAASATAQSAIAALGAAAKLNLPLVGVTAGQMAQAMVDAATKSREVATVFERDLPAALAKLSGPELDKFRTAFIGALQDAGNQAQLLEKVVAATGQRAAEALGVDVVKASKQMSAEFRVAQDNFSILVRSSDELKKSGVDMGQVFEDAFAKMIAGARNQTELEVVRSRIEALGKAGEISKAQVVELMNSLRQKSDEASKGVNSLDEALRTFGIKTAGELKKNRRQLCAGLGSYSHQLHSHAGAKAASVFEIRRSGDCIQWWCGGLHVESPSGHAQAKDRSG